MSEIIMLMIQMFAATIVLFTFMGLSLTFARYKKRQKVCCGGCKTKNGNTSAQDRCRSL